MPWVSPSTMGTGQPSTQQGMVLEKERPWPDDLPSFVGKSMMVPPLLSHSMSPLFSLSTKVDGCDGGYKGDQSVVIP